METNKERIKKSLYVGNVKDFIKTAEKKIKSYMDLQAEGGQQEVINFIEWSALVEPY